MRRYWRSHTSLGNRHYTVVAGAFAFPAARPFACCYGQARIRTEGDAVGNGFAVEALWKRLAGPYFLYLAAHARLQAHTRENPRVRRRDESSPPGIRLWNREDLALSPDRVERLGRVPTRFPSCSARLSQDVRQESQSGSAFAVQREGHRPEAARPPAGLLAARR